MSTVGQPERTSQNRVVALFRDTLKYRYLGNWQYRPNNSNIEEEILRTFLKDKQHYDDNLITKALYELNKVAGDQVRNLYDINKEVYRLLRYGIQVKPEQGEKNETVWLIDWEHPLENDFALAEEVTIRGEHTKRPDIVLYINGIALGVLEMKRSKVSVSEGIRQNLGNQTARFIKSFFNTQQLVMAGNDTEGLRYGTTNTSEKYYLTWKEEGANESPLDRPLLQLCEKERLLEIIHDFTIFDAGTKKLCRPNQYFGVRAAQERIRQREGGIIWHSQGSGKSLTMVWLAKWLREHKSDSRVLLITDRTELDEQIEKIFLGVEENIYRTKSGKDLIEQLAKVTPVLICSLIHKFVGKKESTTEDFIKEMQSSLPANFKALGDIYVFVDECHRTQSGELHEAMKKILPNAMFIGFTGTPLLKSDKKTSIEIFGSYIHTYKFNEAVEDKIVLDLRYEARDIDQNITAPQKIDQWFEAKTKGLKKAALTRLKQKWGTMQKLYSSQSRLEKIVADILLDMEIKERLANGRGNAMLVSGSIYQACKLYELFIARNFDKCAIVTSYKPTVADIKNEETGEGKTEKLKKYAIYEEMLNGKTREEFEKEAKRKFVEEPGQMKLLIVVDKLLTGFDAPSATYLYIDKKMQDHGLFQAICRVNRLDGEDKDYGYIVDYKDLFKSVEGSIYDYTTGALDGYEKTDVEGLLNDRIAKGRLTLDEAREAIKALCEEVDPPKGTLDYMRYFCTDGTAENGASDMEAREPRRIMLYKLTAALIRAFANLANDLPEAGYSLPEIAQIKREVSYYENVSAEIKTASNDNEDLKAYEPAMRYLIDTYIRAEESERVSAFDNISLIDLIVQQGIGALEQKLPTGISNNPPAMAETIENNLRRVIINERPINPVYYDKMSTLLDTLIQERKSQAQDYKKYLQELADLANAVKNPGSGTNYPTSINTTGKRAIYETVMAYNISDKNEEITNTLDSDVKRVKKDSWRGNQMKEKEVLLAIRKNLHREGLDKLENAIFQIIVNQRKEY